MALGMPSPILWGVLTFLLECLPYIGALIMVGLITIASFAAFDSIGQIVLPPLAYIIISSIQNNLVSPFAYGSGLRLNPLAVLIIVVIGWFLWGPAGGVVAVAAVGAGGCVCRSAAAGGSQSLCRALEYQLAAGGGAE